MPPPRRVSRTLTRDKGRHMVISVSVDTTGDFYDSHGRPFRP